MHTAPATHFHLPLPVLESRLLYRNRVLALCDLYIGRRIADETAVDFDVSPRWIRLYLQLPVCAGVARRRTSCRHISGGSRLKFRDVELHVSIHISGDLGPLRNAD